MKLLYRLGAHIFRFKAGDEVYVKETNWCGKVITESPDMKGLYLVEFNSFIRKWKDWHQIAKLV